MANSLKCKAGTEVEDGEESPLSVLMKNEELRMKNEKNV
jgi:hypothetical protein